MLGLGELDLGLEEIRRVLRPGGQLLTLEFFRVSRTSLQAQVTFYLSRVVPLLARIVGGDGIDRFFGQAGNDLMDGGLGDDSGIGFVGSYDGTSFARYELNPVVDGPGAERAASVIALGDELLMYFSEPRDGRRGIAIATH